MVNQAADHYNGPASGHYCQGSDEHPVHFAVFKLANNGTMTGSGSDDVGEFDLHGQVTFSSNIAQFIKQYRGMHAVQYHGFLLFNPAESCYEMQGNWSIGRDSDAFFIRLRST